MNRALFLVLFVLLVVIISIPNDVQAQRRAPKRQPRVGANPTAQSKPLTCTPSQNVSNEPMTYLVGASMTKEDKKRITAKWGALTVPLGETERAKEVHTRALACKQRKIDSYNQVYDAWIKNNPKVTVEEKKKWRKLVDDAILQFTTKPYLKKYLEAERYDCRRDLKVPVGIVENQGEGCNTCWAFASVAAVAASHYSPSYNSPNFTRYIFDPLQPGELMMAQISESKPYVQDLLNCMPIEKNAICKSGWHGNAFDFMVYKKGIPMASPYPKRDKATGKWSNPKVEYKMGEKFTCNPSGGFQNASSWDYVNSPPDKLPSVEQLKLALVEHGPIVAPIFYDECLANYRGGVFNEKDMGMVNHVVLLVGWDNTKQAWLVKNSWGEEWGEEGFGWIKWGSNNIGLFAAWIDADL